MLRCFHRPAFTLVLLLAGAAASAEPLQYENLLQPAGLADGFETGNAFKRDGLTMVEKVPVGESVHNWSEMVTTQIFHRSPMGFADYFGDMQRAWSAACPDSRAELIRDGEENGYPFAVWMFQCHLNPATGKPEHTWIKGIRGNDAFYAVQWAFRREATEADITRAVGHLRKVFVCDSRLERSACPHVVDAPRKRAPTSDRYT